MILSPMLAMTISVMSSPEKEREMSPRPLPLLLLLEKQSRRSGRSRKLLITSLFYCGHP